MPSLVIELPEQAKQVEFNLRRWEQLLADPELRKIEGRIETDRYGHVIMCALSSAHHGAFQAEVGALLRSLLPNGRAIAECPISSADGVKGADVAWASSERIAELGESSCFTRAPEICVEVLSPDNSESEMKEKIALYFDAGALEVWICGSFGEITFFGPGQEQLHRSRLCPKFPQRVELPCA